MIRSAPLAAALLSLLPTLAAADCAGTPGPCLVETGEYHVVLPDSPAADPMPAVMYLHGAGASGATAITNSGLIGALTARGYAVIAPTGSRAFGGPDGHLWAFRDSFPGRDEAAFLGAVMDDASDRFGIDPDHTLLAGFSAGGFMVSYLACATPDAFPAYAPLSGGFWRPHPDSCAGPVRLHQTHGWSDTTVPLEGRYLGGGKWQQGDIFAGMEIWRHANDCPTETADTFDTTGPFWRRSWTACADGSALELALFPGGHMIPPGWADMALDWFEKVVPRN
ncbi:alpha/beta hydrolase family esterase [Chachezhania sediminis]|uniref:alpha/beta hydrolase family esterase n=1 Tax=Chachezhania sediminis TaxID=2599291 RepID=UPI00131BF61A|nr:PHB depolymerase family esterase [Chachezhania sediminis]